MPPDWKKQATQLQKWREKLSKIQRESEPESHVVFERPLPPAKYVQEGTAILVPPLSHELMDDLIEVQKLVKVRAQVFAEQRRRIQELDALKSYLSQICGSEEKPELSYIDSKFIDSKFSELLDSFQRRRDELKKRDNTRALRRVMASFAESARAAALTTEKAHSRVQDLIKAEISRCFGTESK